MKFVFEIHVKPGHTVEEYAAAWSRASALIQQAPGAQGTKLYRKIGEPNVLLAIASWDSKASRDAADAYLMPDAVMRAVLDEPGRFAEFNVLGPFEEPEWTVEPPR